MHIGYYLLMGGVLLTWHWIMLVVLCPFIIKRQSSKSIRWIKQYNKPIVTNIEVTNNLNSLQPKKKLAALRLLYYKFCNFIDSFVRFNRFNSYRDKIKIKPGGIPGYYNIKGEKSWELLMKSKVML